MLAVLDGYCSTVQGLLDWFEVDLGFTELLFIELLWVCRHGSFHVCGLSWLSYVPHSSSHVWLSPHIWHFVFRRTYESSWRVAWLVSRVWAFMTFMCATVLIHLCNMTCMDFYRCDMPNSYVQRDVFKRVTCLSYIIRVTWLLHTCDMTALYVRHDSFIRATCLIHTCDMTPSYVRHDSFIRATWLLHTCDMTPLYVRHDSFIRATLLLSYVRHA